jgi:soluble lytic murein transglycosylase
MDLFIFKPYSVIKWVFIISGFCLLLCSCNAKDWDQGFSQYGFYSTPAATIRDLDIPGRKLNTVEYYILGNAYRSENDYRKAIIHYANASFSFTRNENLKLYPSVIFKFMKGWHVKSAYYQDSAYYIASCYYNLSEFEYANRFASLVEPKEISLYRDAIVLRVKALEQLKKYDEAIAVIKAAIPQFNKKELLPIIYIRLASVFSKKGDYPNALASYMESLRITPEGWQGAVAGKESYSLIKTGKVSTKDLSLVATGLVAAKEYDKAVEVLKMNQSDSFNHDLARVKTYSGKGMMSNVDSIIARYNQHSAERVQLLSAKANILWEINKRAEAIATIKELIKIPQFDNRKEFKRLCYYLYDRNSSEASAYLALFESAYPRDSNADKMLWLAAKPFIERKDFESALPFLTRLIEKHTDSDYSGNARFWFYKILLSENKKDQAEAVFQAMPFYNPGSFYTWILMNRKKNEYDDQSLLKMFDLGIDKKDPVKTLFAHAMLYIKNGNNKDRIKRVGAISSAGMNNYSSFNDDVLKFTLRSEYKQQLIDIEKYYAAGDAESIQRVINSLIIPLTDDSSRRDIEWDRALTLSHYGYKYNNYFQQISGTASLYENAGLQENIFLMDDAIASRIVPLGFREVVEKCAKEFNISKQLVFAVIKAESAFNNKAVSVAGAVGMLQLMPATAKDIAKSIKVKEFELKDPADSIRFGTYYLSWLSRFFKGNRREMVAGYNAGAGNVQLWKKKYNALDEDQFAEQVPFDDTRGYMLLTDKFFIQYDLMLKR